MVKNTENFDVIIIGAGGAGLMCAIESAKKGYKVLIIDHAKKVGNKILISGGGRCNFTNTGASAEKYYSGNKHFVKGIFARYNQNDFINLVKKYNIKFHEKKLGQQFCDESAQQIVDMLLSECNKYNVNIKLNTSVLNVSKVDSLFILNTGKLKYNCKKLVIATGGLSIPKLGATNFGYKIAKQFGLNIVDTSPALVPFTFSTKDIEKYKGLSGISIDAEVSCNKSIFRENILITHRGVSGPAILQISSVFKAGDEINIKMLPDINWLEYLSSKRKKAPKLEIKTVLNEVLPKRFVTMLFANNELENKKMAEISNKYLAFIANYFTAYKIKPNGTEGYRKAEVTLGGVATTELDNKTLMSKKVENLHFIGEVVDVTGWLGGYNFQWAWSSGFICGQADII